MLRMQGNYGNYGNYSPNSLVHKDLQRYRSFGFSRMTVTPPKPSHQVQKPYPQKQFSHLHFRWSRLSFMKVVEAF